MPRPYSTPGMWPSARRRRAVDVPAPVRGVAVSVVCDMTKPRRDQGVSSKRDLERSTSLASQVGRTNGRSALVLPAEDLADAGVVEHCIEGVGDQRGDRQHFYLVDLLLRRQRQG